MICRFDIDLENPHTVTHTFDYIVLRVNPGLISCEDLAMALDLRCERVTYMYIYNFEFKKE